MSAPYILTIDQSTSGTKVLLVNRQADIIHKLDMAHDQLYPHPGWLEHNPEQIYENIVTLLNLAVRQFNLQSGDVQSIAITNQRETCLLWNEDGQSLHNAIVWQCNRTATYCEQLKEQGLESFISQKTGLLISPYFSATKWQWLTQNLNCSNPYAGTIDSWIIYQLTNKRVHATDYTNASRTLLFNIFELSWDNELIELFQLTNLKLPEVFPSDHLFGYVEDNRIDAVLHNVPIYGVVGDSQAALFAQGCFQQGMAKATLGTGSSVLLNIGEKPLPSTNGVVTTIAWKLNDMTHYAYEGIIYSAGDTLAWAKNNLGLFESYDELNELLDDTASSDGVVIIPAFHGIGAPYWNTHAKATIYGLSRSSSRQHLLKACVDSIGHQIRDVITMISSSSSIVPHSLRCDGGGVSNPVLVQTIADFTQLPIQATQKIDLSPLGAAFISGLALNWWTLSDIQQFVPYTHYDAILSKDLAIAAEKQWSHIIHNVHHFYQ